MNIFRKRPLSLILCIMLGGFSFFVESTTTVRLTLIILSGAVIATSFINKELFSSRNTIIRISCAALLLSLILAEAFSSFHEPHKYIGSKAEICGKVKDIDYSAFYASISLECHSINGQSTSKTFLLQQSKDEASDVAIGDTVRVCGRIEEFEKSHDGFNERSYYFSRGFSAKIDDIEEMTVINHKDGGRLPILVKMQRSVSNKLIRATNEHTGGFLAALIMGDKSSLDGNTSLNYSLIGISHILALSGMHLVIISETLRQILSRMRLNKKLILVISTAFCLFYMGVTGFSASVVRSAVMLTITNGLFLITGSHDSYTTLPLSVVLILIVQPHAVFDVSLWLSAFATLGVLVYAEIDAMRPERKRGFITALLLMVWQSVFATIFAIGAAYPIMMCYFDTGSLLAPITTLIFSFPINFLIFAGFILLIFYPALQLGTPVIYITDAINEAAEFIASMQWATYSMDYPIVRALIIVFSILFYLSIIIKIKRMRLMVFTMISIFLSISILGVVLTQSERNTAEFSYIDSGSSDIILTKWDGEVSVVRSGAHSTRAAYADISVIKDLHINYVDKLIFTSYNRGMLTYSGTFFNKLKTETVYLPRPCNQDELEIAEDMAEMLSVYGTNMRFYESETPIDLGRCEYYHVAAEAYEYGNVTASAYTILYRGEFYTYLSAGMPEYNATTSEMLAFSSEYVIFGGYGDVSAQKEKFGLTSPEIKEIYYVNKLPLLQTCKEYYEEKEVPITKIDTSYKFIR